MVQVLKAVDERLQDVVFPEKAAGSEPRLCPLCLTGTLYVRISPTHGGFVACSNYPADKGACGFRRGLLQQEGMSPAEVVGGRALGQDPGSGNDICLCEGPYGWCAITAPPPLDLLAYHPASGV